MTSYVDDNVFPKVVVSEGSAPASPSAGQQKLFLDSADHKLKRVNSAGTVTTIEGGGGSAGAMTQIAQTVVGMGGAATIDFSSISGSYTSLLLEVIARDDSAGTGDNWFDIRFNNDSGANYDAQWTFSSGSSLTASQELAQTSAHAGLQMQGGASAGLAGYSRIAIPLYAGTTWHKGWSAECFDHQSSIASFSFWGHWHSTTAITRITLLSGGGNFAQNSQATLWGIL